MASAAAAAASANDPEAPTHVELATLVIPSDGHHGEEAILTLHGPSAADTSTALAADCAETGGAGSSSGGGGAAATIVASTTADVSNTNTTHIQAVIDLTTLSELAGANDEDEFVEGLHREAKNHHYNPADSSDSSLEHEDEDEVIEVGEEQSLLPPATTEKEETVEVALDAEKFADALDDALPVPETTFAPFELGPQEEDEDEEAEHPTTTTTEDDVQLGHDAFLLELPQHPGETQNYVLALPETHPTHEDDDGSQASSVIFPLLEKAMSIIPTQLPTDIKDVQLEATEVELDKVTTELHLDLVVKRQVPLLGYVILITGFFALSSVGTALDLQGEEVTPTLKTFWRVSATALLLSPFAAHSIRHEGLPKLTKSQWILFPISALAYGYMTAAFVVALSMTSLANAFILSNLTSLVLIAAKAIMGAPVIFLEVLGASVGFTGAAICAGDTSKMGSSLPDASEDMLLVDEPTGSELLGNLIALSASFGMAAYLGIAKGLRQNCNLYVFMFVIMFLAAVFILLYIMLSGEYIEFSAHYNHGVFGWINLSFDRLVLELYMVLSCNFLGTMGYIAVMKYFDSVVIATVMLMEPVVGVFFGYWAGIDPLPGLQTWIGDAIVTIGSAIVIYSGSKTTEHIDATKAMRPRSNTVDISQPMEMKSPAPRKPQVHSRRH